MESGGLRAAKKLSRLDSCFQPTYAILTHNLSMLLFDACCCVMFYTRVAWCGIILFFCDVMRIEFGFVDGCDTVLPELAIRDNVESK